MMPEDYLSNHLRVFKTTAKRSSIRLTVYMGDRSIKEIIQTIIDVVSPPYRIYIGSKTDYPKICSKFNLRRMVFNQQWYFWFGENFRRLQADLRELNWIIRLKHLFF